MHTTIAYKIAQEGEALVRIYDDATELSFLQQQDAINYAAYLLEKGYANVETYNNTVIDVGQFNTVELKRQDALQKLTQDEKQLLGLL